MSAYSVTRRWDIAKAIVGGKLNTMTPGAGITRTADAILCYFGGADPDAKLTMYRQMGMRTHGELKKAIVYNSVNVPLFRKRLEDLDENMANFEYLLAKAPETWKPEFEKLYSKKGAGGTQQKGEAAASADWLKAALDSIRGLSEARQHKAEADGAEQKLGEANAELVAIKDAKQALLLPGRNASSPFQGW